MIQAIIDLAEKAAKEPRELTIVDNAALEKEMLGIVEQDLRSAYAVADKMARHKAVDAAKAKVTRTISPKGTEPRVRQAAHRRRVQGAGSQDRSQQHPRHRQAHRRPRPQDRASDRRPKPASCRARTARRCSPAARRRRWWSTTLGTGEDEQWIDALQGTYKETFLLHYNFPPYSVGETGRMGGTKRREIGHGKLAWRAIHPVLPEHARVSVHDPRRLGDHRVRTARPRWRRVCGASLALMDAGVPLKRPTAGIAMGLILEDERFAVLSDILGDEDHLGDMDFKVAGTEKGITSLQMDIKIAGITEEIMKVALSQAKDGRLHILGEMAKALTEARAQLGEHAPRIEQFKIPTDKIREVIGTGGKVIREIVEKTGAKINIEDDGSVKVASASADSIKAAIAWIKSIANDPEVGTIYEGTVVKVMDFGAFVNFFGAKDGLVHISQLAKSRVNKVTDVVKEGDKVKVKLLGFDDRGKTRLSMKVVDQATGEDLEAKQKAEGGEQPQAVAGE